MRLPFPVLTTPKTLLGWQIKVAYAGVKEPEVSAVEAVFSPNYRILLFSFALNTIGGGGGGAPFWPVCAQKSLYTPELAGVFLRYLKEPVHVVFLVFFCKINCVPLPNIVKNPISNFGSCKLTWKTPICQIICMNSLKSLAKKFF